MAYLRKTPEAATNTATGTANDDTDPARWTFTSAAHPVLFRNFSGGALRVKVNAPNDDFQSSADTGTGYWSIADGTTHDLSEGGLISVENVSAVSDDAGHDPDDASVVGFVN